MILAPTRVRVLVFLFFDNSVLFKSQSGHTEAADRARLDGFLSSFLNIQQQNSFFMQAIAAKLYDVSPPNVSNFSGSGQPSQQAYSGPSVNISMQVSSAAAAPPQPAAGLPSLQTVRLHYFMLRCCIYIE